MGKLLNGVGRGIDFVNEMLGRIIAYTALGLTFVTVYNVILRYAFGRPPIWAWDVNTYFFGMLVFAGAGYHVLHRQYITVDVIYGRMPPKVKAIASLIAFLMMVLFCYIVITEGTSIAMRAIARGERMSSAWGPISYPLRALVPFGAFLIFIQYTRNFISDFSVLIRGKEVEDQDAGMPPDMPVEELGIPEGNIDTDTEPEPEGEVNNGN